MPHEVDADEEEFILKVENENGEIVGGCIAEAYEYRWSRMFLDTLWVDERYRHHGIGSMIIHERIHNPQKADNKLGNKLGNKKPLNQRRSRILAEMRNDPNITTAQLRVILNCAETIVENNIAYLRNNGYIERVGSRKNGYWKVL